MSHKKSLEEKLEKTENVLRENLNTVRAGRANPALLDRVNVDYYGVPTPLKSLANVSVPDARTLMISPFDPSTLGTIEHAINEANLGINPSNDGKCISLGIPQLHEERRKELVKQIKKMGEDAKAAIRNVRRDVNDDLKMQQTCIPQDGTYTDITYEGMQVLKVDFDANKKKIEQLLY